MINTSVKQSVQFLGLGDSQFADLRTNLNQQQAVFRVTNKNPHTYYANEKYAEIQVLDENKKVIFNKEIQGTNVSIGQDTIPLKEGYTIKIYHAETRTRLKSPDFNLINSKSNDNMFIMTKNGLINTLTPVQKKSIHHLVAPTWIFNAGISKGKYHDRQDLGVILQPQATIRIRQVNPHFKDKLTVRLLNDDRLTEKKEAVTSEWSTIQADAISVPFIDTPYGDQNAEVEYTIEGKQIPLPIYQPCGNKMEFFQQWDKEQAGFALVQGPSFQLLVPAKDKEALRNLKEFKSIDELIQYYEEIFQLFNDMIGLEDTDTGTNKMSQNRYFLKADAHGAGGAYYSHDYTANSYATVDMWLKKNNWGPLHEIAHGYQAAFDNKGMYTGEVSNNLFGVQHQYSKNGKDADKIGWLFDYGKKESVEKNLYQAIIKEGKGYTEVDDLRFQLILLTMLKQKAGNEAFTHLYREYRKLANQEGFDANKYPLPDLMNRYYGETSGYDFTPVLKKWKLYTDRIQAEINRSKGYKATASLADIVSESQLSNARKLVDKDILINSNFEMVDNQQIAPLGLKGSVKIQLNIDDINQLKGQDLLLKEGSKVVKRIAITGKELTVQDVPNGVYTIEIPTGREARYSVDKHYLYIKEKENHLTLKIERIQHSDLVNSSFQFLGLGDDPFAELRTNLNQQQAVFHITSKNPHTYYANKKYAGIQVFDENKKVIFDKEIEGTNVPTGQEDIPLKEAYTIKIFHAETGNRLKSDDSNLINTKSNENTFVVTKYGLENTSLKNNAEDDLLKKIDQAAERILANKEILESAVSEMKDQLWVAIQSLSNNNREIYLEKYQSIFK
ncbi:putative mucin/carbohydrate-binding domain-containing protein [Paenibacillus larvae]|uniref:putative mucin/carbohydrate-binding domain-containing protein n=1 Tax=Paenibacillus larvae TaxID=1464 RepID=UPI003AF585D2